MALKRSPNRILSYSNISQGLPNELMANFDTGLLYLLDGSRSVIDIPLVKSAVQLKNGDTIIGTYDPKTGTTASIDLSVLLNSPALKGTPTSTTPATSDSSTKVATTAFVSNVITNRLASLNALIFKGTIGTSGDVTALPASHSIGDTYLVSTAGTYAGQTCEVGDMIICKTAGTTSTNSHWSVVQANLTGVVIGPSSSTAGHIATFTDGTGKNIQDSGYTIATSVPANAVFTDTTYSGTSPITVSGTAISLSNSGVTANSYGPTANSAPGYGGTFVVPYYTVDAKGRLTASGTRTITMPSAQTIPTYTGSNGISVSGTTISMSSSGVTANSYGPTANSAPAHGGTFTVPYFTVNARGQLTAAASRTITLPTVPSYTGSNGVSVSGTAISLSDSGVEAETYGPIENAAPGYGGTFSIPYYTVDAKGRLTASGVSTITMPSAQTIPTYSGSNGISVSGTTISMSSSGVTASTYGPAANASLSYGASFVVPYYTVNARGQLTASGTRTLTLPAEQTIPEYTGSNGISVSGTTISMSNSGVTANTYGPTANVSPAHGASFTVPYFTVNARGQLTAAASRTITLPSVEIPEYTGTSPITVSEGVISLANSGVTASSYGPSSSVSPSHGSSFYVPYFSVDATGRITNAYTRTITLPAAPTSVSSATTATRLATARSIALSGGATGSASFDGSANVTIAATLKANNDYTATVPTTGWTADGDIFYTTITLSGILSTDTPIVDVKLTGVHDTDKTLLSEWSKVYRVTTSDGSITVYVTGEPTTDIPISLKCVRNS